MKGNLALIKKELQENRLWALLSGIGFFLALYQGWNETINENDWLSNEGVMSRYLATALTFTPMVIGALIGFLQVFREVAKDRWAFFYHRSATPSQLFYAKFFAGTLLYFSAMGLPYAYFCWQSTLPGVIGGPFFIEMIYPGLIDICSGWLFYLTALWLGLWDAKWFPHKVAGLIGSYAMVGMVTVKHGDTLTGGNQIGDALIMFLFAAAALFLIAKNVFRFRDAPHRFTLAARLALWIVLAIGALQVITWMDAISYAIQGKPQERISRAVLEDGKIVNTYERNFDIYKVTTVDGIELDLPKDEIINRFESKLYTTRSYMAQIPANIQDWMGYRRYYKYVEEINLNSIDEGTSRWFFLRKTGQLLGYNKITRQLEWSADFTGVYPQTDLAKARSFSQNLEYAAGRLLVFTNLIYEFNPRERTFRVVYNFGDNPPEEYHIASIPWNSSESEFPNKERYVFLKTADTLKCISRSDLREIISIHLPSPPHYKVDDIFIHRNASRFYLFYDPDWRHFGDDYFNQPTYVDIVDLPSGKHERMTIPQLPKIKNEFYFLPKDWLGKHLWRSVQNFAIYPLIDSLRGAQRHQAIWRWDPHSQKKFYEYTIWALLTGVGSVVAMLLLRRRKRSLVETVAVGLVIFLTGIPGLIAWWLYHPWSLFQKCPACGAFRNLEEEACATCDALWPTPEKDGTEIMERSI